jgi:transcriptional regulator with XRE-family HTH domain
MSELIIRLNLIKKQRGLTVHKIADDIGVSRPIMTNYFNGRTEIPASVIPELSAYLNIDITWLLTGHGSDIAAEPETKYQTGKQYGNNPPDSAIRASAESFISMFHRVELLTSKTDFLENELRKLQHLA